MFGGVPIRLSWPTTSPSQRKALLERYPPSQSKELFAFASTRTESHETDKYYGAITQRMNFDCPVAETSEGIEPNVNDVELNAIAYSFSNIFEFEPELKQFLRRS